MNEIITILATLSSTVSNKSLRQLIVIVEATLAMTGRVTMLGISRWTGKGGSYRTVQRFFDEEHHTVRHAGMTYIIVMETIVHP